MRRHVATSSALATGLLLSLLPSSGHAFSQTSHQTSYQTAYGQAAVNSPTDRKGNQLASFITTKQVPNDIPGRAPVEPVDFPTDIPAEPVDSLSEQSLMDEGAEEPVETEANMPLSHPVATWRIFTSEVGRFRVAMPTPPAMYTFSADVADSSRMYMQMQLVNASQLEVYAAAFIELPGELSGTAASGGASESALALRGCIENVSDWPLQAEPTEIFLGDYRGVEAEVQTADGFQVSRCYLAGDRAYMLTATNEVFDPGSGLIPFFPEQHEAQDEVQDENGRQAQPLAQERSSAMKAFFDSFEILESGSAPLPERFPERF